MSETKLSDAELIAAVMEQDAIRRSDECTADEYEASKRFLRNHARTLAERLRAAGEERERNVNNARVGLSMICEDASESTDPVFALSVMAEAFKGRAEKAESQLTAANARIAEAETTYKILLDQLGNADAERHQAVARLHEAQVQALGFADHSPAITWPELYREACRRIAELEGQVERGREATSGAAIPEPPECPS